MTPLQIMQQRTTKGMAVIQPELQRIQAKYKDKKDAESQAKFSAETQKLYKEHKINPLAGCLPLIIQLPLIMALFGVLRDASSYITRLQDVYVGLATNIMNSVGNYKEILNPFLETHSMNGKIDFDLAQVTTNNGVLGVKELLSKLTSVQWTELLAQIPADAKANIQVLLDQKTNFEWFGVNLVDTPAELVSSGMWIALIVPILVWISTMIYSKYTMAQNEATQAKTAESDQQAKTMNMMNTVLPLMTAFFSYTMPCGLALYWIVGNVIMLLQQIIVTRMIEPKSVA